MIKTKYKEIDQVLLPWAARHTLYVNTEYKDEEVRSILVVNEFADVYMIYVIPKTDYEPKNVIVGADLQEIGGKKHTFHRQTRGFHFREEADFASLEALLDRALQLTREWASDIPRGQGKG